jgi:predicted metal-binding membrane protein
MRVVADRRYFLLLMGGLIALAWLTLWLWGQSPYGRLLNHDELSGADLGNGLVVLVIVVGWTLMVVAMMLPTSLPLVALFHRLTRQRQDHALLVSLLIAGYLSMWTLFGMVVHLGDGLLHVAVAQSAWLEAHAWAIGASILVLAGVCQFTPLKYACLDKCRSPLSFITEHWRGSHERAQAFRLGVASRPLLYWVLLVADAADVRRWGWESRVDAGLGSLDGHRKEPAMGPALQRPIGCCSALLGTHPRPASGIRVVMSHCV